MANSKPLVSIGMPVYNGERFIRQALDSLLAQDYENFELIISDNASTDGTSDICQEYLAKDKRVRYHRNHENIGPIANFCQVLEYAKGEYFMWAACDDVWEPTYIKTLLQSLLRTPSAVIAFSALDTIDEHNHYVRTYPYLFELPSADLFTRLRNYINQEEYLGKANPIYGLMRRSAIQMAGGFRVWGKGIWGMDMLVVFRLLSLGELVLSRDVVFHARIHKWQFSSSAVPPRMRRLRLLPARLLLLSSTLKDWHGYFSGYARIINVADTLSVSEKRMLRKVLDKRARNVYRREVERALASPFIVTVLRKVMYISSTIRDFMIRLINKSFSKSGNTSFAQCGEDLIVKHVFDAIGRNKPTYVDVGAYDPCHFNNTALFYRSGSRGINIEPDPCIFKNLAQKRERDVNLNIGISNAEGELDFYMMSVPTLSTFSKSKAEEYVSKHGYSIRSVRKVKVDTLPNIIDRYFDGRFPDFLSLDTEGLDLDILKSIDYERNCPAVICVETLTFSNTGRGVKDLELIEYLQSKGYMVYADTNINTIFVRRDEWIQ